MDIPILSIVTLLTELVITASVYFIIWKAYRTGAFMRRLAFAILGYELLFNISYMLSRELGVDESTVVYNPYETGLAIFHGTFSLLMFVMLFVFFIMAARAYRRGENYFLIHPRLTWSFVLAWGVSILSGIAFFASLYIL
jgi:hypothetical protein